MVLAIIAAGDSPRLLADGVSEPKPLVAVHGEPLIGRLIRIAALCGIDGVRCIINNHTPTLQHYLATTDFGIPVKFIVESTPSSMHSFFALAPMLCREPFLLTTINSIFLEEEFRKFLVAISQPRGATGTFAVTRDILSDQPLYAHMEGRVIRELTDSPVNAPWAVDGLYYFSPDIFTEIDTALGKKIVRLRNFLKLLLARGYHLEGFPFSKIIDINQREDIHCAEQFLKAHTPARLDLQMSDLIDD